MSPTEILIQIIGGVCLLLWGVGMVNKGLNEAFGASLRRAISRSTSNRFAACLVGMGIAALLQSSTAASLIVSTFAARSIITIPSAIAVMLGADVGTTLAAQIMSLNLHWLTPVMLAAGYTINQTMSGSLYRHIGRAMIGIGLALLSLKLITTVAEPLKHSELLQALITSMSDQPVLAVLISALVTWLVHSSLGMVLLYTSFITAGTLPVTLGLYLVLGSNIGGTIGPVVMTLRDMPLGRRVPLGNLFIRAIGVLMVLPFMDSLILPMISKIHPDPSRMLVNFHTFFNLLLALVFLPFTGPMTRLSEKILPDRLREEDESVPRYLDPAAINAAPAALAGAARETLRLSDIIQKMTRDTLESFRINNPRLVQDIREKEKNADSLYESIKLYLSRLSIKDFSEKEMQKYTMILVFSTNLEHVGDIIDKSLMNLAMKKIRNQDSFSKEGFSEITDLHSRVMESMTLAQNIFMSNDVDMAKKMLEDKASMRSYEIQASKSHFRRLGDGVAETIATSSLHLDILRDLRRINSYITLIAYPLLDEPKKSDRRKNNGGPPDGVERRRKADRRKEYMGPPEDVERRKKPRAAHSDAPTGKS